MIFRLYNFLSLKSRSLFQAALQNVCVELKVKPVVRHYVHFAHTLPIASRHGTRAPLRSCGIRGGRPGHGAVR